MKLNQYTDYSLRVLIYLAGNEKESTTRKISEYFDISRNHLTKVIHQLSRKGYLATTTGKFGGIRLAMSPEEINIRNVIQDMETGFEIVECLGPANSCRITGICNLLSVFDKARESFLAEIGKFTLHDIINHQPAFAQKFKK